MKNLKSFTFSAAIVIALFSVAALAAPSNFSLFGDSKLVSPGKNSPTAARLQSDSDSPNYGGVDFAITAGLTFASYEKLSLDYKFTVGSCGGGAPRVVFELKDPETGEDIGPVFSYIGPPPNYTDCPKDVWFNTGDLLETGKTLDTGEIGGTFYDPYESVLEKYGAYEVSAIYIVVDAVWYFPETGQSVDVDNVMINNTTYTFESANSCKNGGYLNFVGSPGPFKNQGECVSYFAKGGQ